MTPRGFEGWVKLAVDRGRGTSPRASCFQEHFLVLAQSTLYIFDRHLSRSEVAQLAPNDTLFVTIDDAPKHHSPAETGDPSAMATTPTTTAHAAPRSMFRLPKLGRPKLTRVDSHSERHTHPHNHPSSSASNRKSLSKGRSKKASSPPEPDMPSSVSVKSAIVRPVHPSILRGEHTGFPHLLALHVEDFRLLLWFSQASSRCTWHHAISSIALQSDDTFLQTEYTLGIGRLSGTQEKAEYRVSIFIDGFLEARTTSSIATSTLSARGESSAPFSLDCTLTLCTLLDDDTSTPSFSGSKVIVEQWVKKRWVAVCYSDTQNADWSGSRRIPRITLKPYEGTKRSRFLLDFDYKDRVLTVLPMCDYEPLREWFREASLDKLTLLESSCKSSQAQSVVAMSGHFYTKLVGTLVDSPQTVKEWLLGSITADLRKCHQTLEASEGNEERSLEGIQYGRSNNLSEALLTGVLTLYGKPWLHTALEGVFDEVSVLAERFGEPQLKGNSREPLQHAAALMAVVKQTWAKIKAAQADFPGELRRILFELGESVASINFSHHIVKIFDKLIKTSIVVRFIVHAICNPFHFDLSSYKLVSSQAEAKWATELSKAIKVLFFRVRVSSGKFADDLFDYAKSLRVETNEFLAHCCTNTALGATSSQPPRCSSMRYQVAGLAYDITLLKRKIKSDIVPLDGDFMRLFDIANDLFPLIHQPNALSHGLSRTTTRSEDASSSASTLTSHPTTSTDGSRGSANISLSASTTSSQLDFDGAEGDEDVRAAIIELNTAQHTAADEWKAVACEQGSSPPRAPSDRTSTRTLIQDDEDDNDDTGVGREESSVLEHDRRASFGQTSSLQRGSHGQLQPLGEHDSQHGQSEDSASRDNPEDQEDAPTFAKLMTSSNPVTPDEESLQEQKKSSSPLADKQGDPGLLLAMRTLEALEASTPVVFSRYILLKQAFINTCRELAVERSLRQARGVAQSSDGSDPSDSGTVLSQQGQQEQEEQQGQQEGQQQEQEDEEYDEESEESEEKDMEQDKEEDGDGAKHNQLHGQRQADPSGEQPEQHEPSDLSVSPLRSAGLLSHDFSIGTGSLTPIRPGSSNSNSSNRSSGMGSSISRVEGDSTGSTPSEGATVDGTEGDADDESADATDEASTQATSPVEGVSSVDESLASEKTIKVTIVHAASPTSTRASLSKGVVVI